MPNKITYNIYAPQYTLAANKYLFIVYQRWPWKHDDESNWSNILQIDNNYYHDNDNDNYYDDDDNDDDQR